MSRNCPLREAFVYFHQAEIPSRSLICPLQHQPDTFQIAKSQGTQRIKMKLVPNSLILRTDLLHTDLPRLNAPLNCFSNKYYVSKPRPCNKHLWLSFKGKTSTAMIVRSNSRKEIATQHPGFKVNCSNSKDGLYKR